jgi:hypothetical protein
MMSARWLHAWYQLTQDESAADWQDAMDPTGSMGGESNKNVVRVAIVVEGGARICVVDRWAQTECCFTGLFFLSASTKNHLEKKANVKSGQCLLRNGLRQEAFWMDILVHAN